MMNRQERSVVHQRDLTIELLQESELPEAIRVLRLAFGTFLGMPDPGTIWADSDYLETRWHADPTRVFVAKIAGEIVGTNVATHWGSIGFFGPLSVRPDLWDQGIAQRLLEPVVDSFAARGVRHSGLFTFAQSTKHLYLYQKFGFYPRFLTVLLSKSVVASESNGSWSKWSDLSESEQGTTLQLCREVTGAIYDGLNVSIEIQAIQEQHLGETVLLWNGSQLVGLACCQCGVGTEAGTDTCYIKFAAVLPGPTAAASFDQLLLACEALAVAQGSHRLIAGVNLGRQQAHQCLLAAGFRADMMGVAMEKPNEPGYNHDGVYLIDDWR